MHLFILMCSILSLSLLLIIAPNPLSMGLIILLIGLTVASIYSLTMSSWLAFLIFLIYVGGMLVMFSYFVSLTPNQPLTSNFNFELGTSMTPIFMILYLSTDMSMSNPSETLNLTQYLYLPSNSSILVLLVGVLLITMLIIAKICKHTKGPMRSFMSYV